MPTLRFLATRKTLTAIAVLTMALALGANAAALAVLDAFLLSSLAVPEPERVVVIAPQRDLPGRGTVMFADAYPNYELLRKTQRSFADVSAYVQLQASWATDGEARPLRATSTTASFFSAMRLEPMLGRAFVVSEEGPSPAPVVVISHALWRAAFATDSAVVGRTMSLNGSPHTVIGVMPEGFAQPAPTDIWLPFDIPVSQRTIISGGRQLTILGRLADGTSLEQALAEMRRFTALSIETSPADNKDYRYDVSPLRDVLLNGADSSALFVQAGAATLLVLAILNLASLLVAWGFERRREMAVRIALGATSGQVARLLLHQSVAIVAAGAALGVPLAWLALRTLQQLDLGPTVSVFVAKAHIDPGILLATAAIAVVSALAAAALPAWFNRDASLGDALRLSSRSATLSPQALRWQQAMVVGQAALSAAILAAAVLIIVSFWRLMEIPHGFSARDRVVAKIVLPAAEYGTHAARATFGSMLADNLAAEADIASGGFTTTLPVSDIRWGGRFYIELPDGSRTEEPVLFHFRRVSPGYLATMDVPLLSGRQFTTRDDTSSIAVAIVSEALAARFWPNEDAVGKRMLRAATTQAPPTPVTVVGVVGNTMDAGYDAPAGEAVYVPYSQLSSARLSIVARSRGDVRATTAAIRRAIRNTDAKLAASDVSTLDALVVQANALPRLRTLVLLVFSLVALGIVSLGSYGVMSQLVSNRERELAVRLVFGAQPTRLGASVLVQAVKLTLFGIAMGLAVVWFTRGLLEAFVFGVRVESPLVLGGAGAALLLVALIATLPPAMRAMRVDIRRGIAG